MAASAASALASASASVLACVSAGAGDSAPTGDGLECMLKGILTIRECVFVGDGKGRATQ